MDSLEGRALAAIKITNKKDVKIITVVKSGFIY